MTGNVDKPGACVLAEASDFVSEMELEMTDALAPEHRARCLNTPYTPLQCYEGYARLRPLTERLGRTLPERYLTSAHPDLVLRAMETGEPYPVRALVVNATNPLLTYADTHRVFDALMGLDLLVVLEYYLTPTASIADYVLPIAGAIERPILQVHGGVANIGYGGPAAVEPYHERRTGLRRVPRAGSAPGGRTARGPRKRLPTRSPRSWRARAWTGTPTARRASYYRAAGVFQARAAGGGRGAAGASPPPPAR